MLLQHNFGLVKQQPIMLQLIIKSFLFHVFYFYNLQNLDMF